MKFPVHSCRRGFPGKKAWGRKSPASVVKPQHFFKNFREKMMVLGFGIGIGSGGA